MQFTLSAVVLAFAGLAAAMPAENHQQGAPRFSVPDSLTVKQAQSKCGNQAQLSCCNSATYAGDTTDINSGILSGALSNLIGAGSGAKGLGIFDQCSKLDAQIPIIGIAAQDILNQKCKQNIACCANSPSEASNDLVGAGLPCVALGSIL
ncbi:unnamed protein product [Penicillium nalgiovense]|uniref:Hydrophobin n=1 Tax=Penicillium nalgiovense TaxID=60175 RepID=A0A1V6YYF2_PENNA|nr:hypothetical protein PENNAL_c0007G00088 [Penicillium nalgiovense]CAG7979502.1 unnamed protein product [Penicillium nalgiovense]CAG8026406.1 unnamed protein product [Penicillium nalgiovense]CAG8142108.1 unnamed protein product [Penicillium nalgiovense]CAG8191335.1 unnamed protein product [Penicillium nalgiovense]